MKRCSRCEAEKPNESFYRYKRSKDGLTAYCKECDKIAKQKHYRENREAVIERVDRWQSKNPEKVRAYKRTWKRNNPESQKVYKQRRRTWAAGDSFTVAEWNALLEEYNHVCLACGASEALSVDHVIPLSKGGANTIDNIQPLCVPCNIEKGIKETDYRNEF